MHTTFLHVFAFFESVPKTLRIYFSTNISNNDRLLVSFWRPLDFEGIPKSTIFENIFKANKKKDLQEGGLNKHDLLIDFDARAGCLEW